VRYESPVPYNDKRGKKDAGEIKAVVIGAGA
jgi:hypothetical protein